ncbi:MAG: signal peptide peptidase SppA [Rikenellaceae bacterium]
MGTFAKQFLATIAAIVASIVIFIVALVIVVSVSIGVITSQSSEPIQKGSVLEINMDQLIVDAPDLSPIAPLKNLLSGAAPQVSMVDLFRALEFAAGDKNITALSLRLDGDEHISLANASEMRDLISNFRLMSAKPVFAYAENYSQVEYLLASVVDSMYIHPLGSIEWQGVAVNTLYYGDLFEKVGVEAEVFRPESCRYKSAVEPYIRSDMSIESREQNSNIVNTFWDSILSEVSISRKVSVEELRRVAKDQIIVEAKEAKQRRLVDVVAYRDGYDAALERLGVVRGEGGKLRTTTLANYAYSVRSAIEEESRSIVGGANKIAIIYADGVIVDGDIPSASGGEVVSGVVARQLRRARLDKDIKAVVVRVNSPGGSALAADVIWREMDLLQRVKPVIVTMGSYAASGGYYISAPADVILTNRYTLTGSIGVYGVMFAYEDALRRHLHISTDGVVSEPSADFGRVARGITPIERAAVMRGVETVYDKFQECVVKGRKLSPAVVSTLSGGRVWCGKESVGCGLTDGVGGLREALSIAVDRCDMGNDVIELVEYGSEYDNLTSSFGGYLLSNITASNTLLTELKALLLDSNKVMALTPQRVKF